MKKSSSELKSMAKGALLGRYGLPIGANILVGLVSVLISLSLGFVFPGTNTLSLLLYMIASMIVSLLFSILGTGTNKIMLNMSRGYQAGLNDLTYGFMNHPDRIILLSLLLILMVWACMIPAIAVIIVADITGILSVALLGLLLSLGGVVAAFIVILMYSQVFYLYLDDPDKGVMPLMRESRELMRGNKGRLFYLYISFFGLILLSVLTCYIGLLWLTPYTEMTCCLFYRELIGEI